MRSGADGASAGGSEQDESRPPQRAKEDLGRGQPRPHARGAQAAHREPDHPENHGHARGGLRAGPEAKDKPAQGRGEEAGERPSGGGAHPTTARDAHGAAQTEPKQEGGGLRQVRLSEERHRTGSRDVPTGVAKESRTTASRVPSRWSDSAASRRSSLSRGPLASRVSRGPSKGSVSGTDEATVAAASGEPTAAGKGPSSGCSVTSGKTKRYPWRETVRMKTGSRESSPSARRSVRTAWLRAPSETTTSLHTASKISRRCTAWLLRSTRRTRRSK